MMSALTLELPNKACGQKSALDFLAVPCQHIAWAALVEWAGFFKRRKTMARKCYLSGKRPRVINSVSAADNRTKRRQLAEPAGCAGCMMKRRGLSAQARLGADDADARQKRAARPRAEARRRC